MAFRGRLTASRMASADLVHRKGLAAWVLCVSSASPPTGGTAKRKGSGVAAGAGPTMTLQQGRAMKLKVVIREAEEGGIWRQGC